MPDFLEYQLQVQAVLLLLGGRDIPGSDIPSSVPSSGFSLQQNSRVILYKSPCSSLFILRDLILFHMLMSFQNHSVGYR